MRKMAFKDNLSQLSI